MYNEKKANPGQKEVPGLPSDLVDYLLEKTATDHQPSASSKIIKTELKETKNTKKTKDDYPRADAIHQVRF